MTLPYVDSFDWELPPCFKAWCACGWVGRCARGYLYVPGQNIPLEEYLVYSSTSKCPKCQKEVTRLLDRDSLRARFRWALDNLSQKVSRDGDVFPCTCNPTPTCRLDSEVIFTRSLLSDTVFCDDHDWLRLTAKTKCNGCHAKSRIAYVENPPSKDFWREPWVVQRTTKEWHEAYNSIWRDSND